MTAASILSGGVVSTRPGDPDFFDRTSTGIGVGYWRSKEPEELSADCFDSRVVCIHLRDTVGSIWTNRRLTFDKGRVAAGAWQAHAPGDAFHGVAFRGYELLRVVVTEAALERVLAGFEIEKDCSALELLDPCLAPSAFLLDLAAEIKAAMAAELPPPRLYVENLTGTLLSYLVARHSNVAGLPVNRPSTGGLAPWQLRHVQNQIVDQLTQDPSLADLAGAVGLSPYHFARAFKASTGLPPHRYLMTRRVERAKELLAGTTLSVTEVAHACGFASSQHMATVFRRLVGTTPTEYRRQGRL